MEQDSLRDVRIMEGRWPGTFLRSRARSNLLDSARRAFEEAYDAHKGRLLTLATAMLGDRATAEDVVHDVFAMLAADPSRLDGNAGLTTYLSVCARNRAVDVIRARTRRADREGAYVAARPSSVTVDPAGLTARAEQERLLLKGVAELPAQDRGVVALYIWGEMTFDEIAGLEGVSKSTAYRRYMGALDALRKRLNGGI
jgi:RNA polymerase sigma-70 factor (ECF subfamily)